MGQVWTRQDWNDLIGRINGLADQGCLILDPLPEVPEGHIWTVQDIIAARNLLTEVCVNSPSFEAETVKWTVAIIDELNEAIDDCECEGCEIGYIETSPITHIYDRVTFATASELWYNERAPLVYDDEATMASQQAQAEWDALVALLSEDGSQEEVDAQVASLNLAASIAWGYITAAYTERYNMMPIASWLDTGLIQTAEPVLRYNYVELVDTWFRQWTWCQTTAVVRVTFHRCGFGTYWTYRDDCMFTGAPNGAFFGGSAFAHNWHFACALNFVGDGDCEDTDECVNYLNGLGLQHSITSEYETMEMWSPGTPI